MNLSDDEAQVIKAQSGFYTLQISDSSTITARVRGKMKHKPQDSTIVAVGDRVRWETCPEGGFAIVKVLPRERALSRLKPLASGRGTRRWDRQGYLREKEQVLIANPDQVAFVLACAQPEPRLRPLDRLLVGAERQNIPILICVNKIDLAQESEVRERFAIYEAIGYQVLYTSARTGAGVEALRTHLRDKITALVGPSGAGKTSLLNALQPGLGRRIRSVSEATGKGRHTTTVTEMIPLEAGGWVADTPGIRALALFDLEPEEIDAYFPDIAPHVPHCAFSDCHHHAEPGCAVLAALKAGQIDQHRYESYVRLQEEHQKLADMYWWGIDEE